MSLPTSPKTPAWLQFFQWVTNPVAYMETNVQQYPDIFNAKVVGKCRQMVFVNHPEGIQKLLTHDTKEFSAPGEVNEIVRPLVGDHSVLLLGGDRHKRQRKLLMPPFHGERMRTYGNLIAEVTQKAMSPLKPGQTFIARSVMQEISLQVILQAVFGLYEGERYEQIKQGISAMLEVFQVPSTSSLLFFPSLQKDLGAWSPWGYMRRQQQKVDELLYAEIEDRRQTPHSDETDILSLLM